MTERGSLFPERDLIDAGPKTPRLLTSEQKYRVFDKIRTEIAGEARKTTFCKELWAWVRNKGANNCHVR